VLNFLFVAPAYVINSSRRCYRKPALRMLVPSTNSESLASKTVFDVLPCACCI